MLRCVENCGNGSYADLNAKRCKQCLAECETCSNAENCDTCPIGKVIRPSETNRSFIKSIRFC